MNGGKSKRWDLGWQKRTRTFTWGYGFWGEDHRDEAPFPSHAIESTCYQRTGLTTVDVGLDYPAGDSTCQSLRYKVPLSPHSHYTLGKQVTAHTEEMGS